MPGARENSVKSKIISMQNTHVFEKKCVDEKAWRESADRDCAVRKYKGRGCAGLDREALDPGQSRAFAARRVAVLASRPRGRASPTALSADLRETARETIRKLTETPATQPR